MKSPSSLVAVLLISHVIAHPLLLPCPSLKTEKLLTSSVCFLCVLVVGSARLASPSTAPRYYCSLLRVSQHSSAWLQDLSHLC